MAHNLSETDKVRSHSHIFSHRFPHLLSSEKITSSASILTDLSYHQYGMAHLL